MKRLQLLLGVVFLSFFAGSAVADKAVPGGVVDCHVHFWDLTRPEGIGWIDKENETLYRDFKPEDFAPIAKENGVTGVVVVQAGQSLPDNRWNLEITAHNKDLYRGVVGNLSTVIGTADFASQFGKLCEDGRYVGYRLSGRYQDDLTDALFRDLHLTAKRERTVDVLVGGYTLKDVAVMAKRVPELKIIIDHFGNLTLDGKPLDAGWVRDFRAVAECPNVSCKVSALYGRVKKQPAPRDLEFYRPVLDLAWECFGEDRLVYGSDWPVTRTSGDYASVVALTKAYFDGKGEGASLKLFRDNAVEFYGLRTAKPVIRPGQKMLPMAGESFQLDGHDAFVILPAKPAEGRPWVWYAPTLKGLPAKSELWMFERFLKEGIAVAGIDVGESYGSPTGRGIYSALYEHLTTSRKFGKKPIMLARSRGGLMLYSWAVENPESVGGVAGIYPVCNIASYPGVKKAAGAYGMTAEELQEKLTEHNPVDRLEPLARAKVPVFHIHGDSDKVVPLDKNTAVLEERYKAFGGPIEVEVVAGQGHNMWKGWFESQRLVDFVIRHANAGADDLGAALKALDLPGVKIDVGRRVVDVESEICLGQGALELVACTKDTKEHESIVTVQARAMHIHTALLLLGARPGSPAMRKVVEGEVARWIDIPPQGAEVGLSLVYKDETGKTVERPIGEFIRGTVDEEKKFPTSKFLFTGSRLHGEGPGPRRYLADGSGNVVTISTFGDELLGLAGVHSHDSGGLMWQVDPTHLPKLGTKVILRFRPVR